MTARTPKAPEARNGAETGREAIEGSKSAIARRRPKDTGPWCWQQKKARRLIRERMNGDSKTVYVLSVYDALSEIASDESSETFKTSHPYLAAKAGCGVSQLKLALEELIEAALVLIETPKLRGPCTFTLLAITEEDSVSRNATNDSRNTANVSHKANLSVMATVEERSEKRSEEKKKHGFKKPRTSFPAEKQDRIFLKQLNEECSSEERREFILKFNEYARSHSHALLPITVYTDELDKALDSWDDGFEEIGNCIVEAVENFKGPSNKRLTLVRICHDSR